MLRIRPETIADIAARELLLDACFGPERCARTCERLREKRLPARGLSFVAEDQARVIGSVRLWHVTAGPGRPALLLGPLAVDAAYRGQGAGGRLMDTALQAATALGHRAVLLVGDAPYYARHGFSGLPTRGLWLPGPVERERFLGLELRPGALAGAFGLVSPTGEPLPLPDLAALAAEARRGGWSRAA